MADEERISLSEAARRAGVAAATLSRWAEEGVIPVRRGRWTNTTATQARLVARMRERGHSLEELKIAGREGRLASGLAEEVFADRSERVDLDEAAERTGLDHVMIERMMTILGTPTEGERTLSEVDLEALGLLRRIERLGLPVEAALQILRVYVQSVRRIADAEVRLFHLFVHEPMIRDGMSSIEISEEIGSMVEAAAGEARPLFEYLHNRYVRYYLEQDVIGHMEADFGGDTSLDHIRITLCFIDLTGFTRFTEEEGDAEAFSVIERFTEAVEATLPPDANIVKTIGDEVMLVSPDPEGLVEWAVGFLALFEERPKPRAGIHYGAAVFRDGDYFGSQVNLAHRVVNRALAGEVMITDAVRMMIDDHPDLDTEAIGAVDLKGFPEPTPLFLVHESE